MLSGRFLAIMKTAKGKMIYVDYCKGEIDNLPYKFCKLQAKSEKKN